MDDVIVTPPAKISTAEMDRRRKIIRRADASNRIEGVFRGPETDAIVEAFVRGDIEVTDMIPLFAAQPAPR